MAGEGDAFILIIVAIIFPPAAVAFISGCGADLCLNILLTLLAYLPGFLHAVWLIMKRAEANERYGYKNWTYAGMGEYNAVGGVPATVKQPAPYPPPAQPPAAPPPTQAEQQPAGYAQPPLPSQPPSDVKYVYQVPPQPPADQKVVPSDQKQGEYAAPTAPPAVPADQKVDGGQKQNVQDQGQAPAPAPADQKAINVTPPADQK